MSGFSAFISTLVIVLSLFPTWVSVVFLAFIAFIVILVVIKIVAFVLDAIPFV